MICTMDKISMTLVGDLSKKNFVVYFLFLIKECETGVSRSCSMDVNAWVVCFSCVCV